MMLYTYQYEMMDQHTVIQHHTLCIKRLEKL
nr:MAG TPA: hypothetical protein [Caudoviricetes sp.]